MNKGMLADYRPNWFSIVFWFLVGCLLPGILARGESYIPTPAHVKAAETATDCSIFRKLITTTSNEIQEGKHELLALNESLAQRRESLESCARANGIPTLRDEQGEALAAELCPSVYDAWLSPGYRVQMIKQDIKAARQGLELLVTHLQWRCRALPPSNVVPTASGMPSASY